MTRIMYQALNVVPGKILSAWLPDNKFWWQAPSLEARLRNIVEALTFDVYNYTCLSLFECHKLMFSFQVCATCL